MNSATVSDAGCVTGMLIDDGYGADRTGLLTRVNASDAGDCCWQLADVGDCGRYWFQALREHSIRTTAKGDMLVDTGERWFVVHAGQ